MPTKISEIKVQNACGNIEYWEAAERLKILRQQEKSCISLKVLSNIKRQIIECEEKLKEITK